MARMRGRPRRLSVVPHVFMISLLGKTKKEDSLRKGKRTKRKEARSFRTKPLGSADTTSYQANTRLTRAGMRPSPRLRQRRAPCTSQYRASPPRPLAGHGAGRANRTLGERRRSTTTRSGWQAQRPLGRTRFRGASRDLEGREKTVRSEEGSLKARRAGERLTLEGSVAGVGV